MNTYLQRVACGDTPTMEEWEEVLVPLLPLMEQLAFTQQDPLWHAEGDVRTHTAMVLEEMNYILQTDGEHWSAERKQALVLSALLHDIAKPLVTREQIVDGEMRIVSPRHADKGRSYLACKLIEADISCTLVHIVMALVGHHHDLKRLVVRDAPAREYRKLARLVDVELLYWLELADTRGRICADKQKEVDMVELFRLHCQEYGVWRCTAPYSEWLQELHGVLHDIDNNTRQYIAAHSIREYESGLIVSPHEAVARSWRYRQGWPQIVLTVGASGAGKSTWIHDNLMGYCRVSLDELRECVSGARSNQAENGRVLQAAREALKEHLRKKRKVVWDATNLRRDMREGIVQLAMEYHAHVTLVAFHLAESTVRKRNKQRDHAVPDNVIARQWERLEWPYAHEAHRLLHIDALGDIIRDEGGEISW